MSPALPTASQGHGDTTHRAGTGTWWQLLRVKPAQLAVPMPHKPHRAPCPRTHVLVTAPPGPCPAPSLPAPPGAHRQLSSVYPATPGPRGGVSIPWAASDTPCTRQTAAANTLVILEGGRDPHGHGRRELQQHGRFGGEQRRQLLILSAQQGLRGRFGLGRARGRLGRLVTGGGLLLFGRGSAWGRARTDGV